MLPMLAAGAAVVATGLAPGCHHATIQQGSTAPAAAIVFCLPGPNPFGDRDARIAVINDGADNDTDRGDVFLTFWVPG